MIWSVVNAQKGSRKSVGIKQNDWVVKSFALSSVYTQFLYRLLFFATEPYETLSINYFCQKVNSRVKMCNCHTSTIIFNKAAGAKGMIYFITGYDDTLPHFSCHSPSMEFGIWSIIYFLGC